ncbi:MAG: tubulin-like doman-containing protein [Cyanobacteria bacterium P01_C01_bin.89]
MAAVEEKSMVPTILIGIGGTGAEVLSRVRRLVVETYGGLDKFPILGFLWIDTDKDYKVSNPEAAGPVFKDNERHWARVTGKEAQNIVENMDNYPWIDRWFPNELQKNLTSLEAGAGQIRACGRFAYFVNASGIEKKFKGVLSSTRGNETYMQDTYGVKVAGNQINVFVTGSLSGGTGSGMLIDLGYGIQDWTQGEGSVTAVVPTPNAFSTINVGDRVLSNGYAALMELSYFSDDRTTYREAFSSGVSTEIVNKKPPFTFTYLVGIRNEQVSFKLDQVREAIAQHIFLDLTSEFAPHKRSIRDNIKSSWAERDPGGRGYPKNFMSFGLSTVEIPIAQIRTSMAYRLSADLAGWWLNGEAPLPPNMLDLVRGDLLDRMGLTERKMLSSLLAAKDRPYTAVIAEWLNGIRNEISNENLLECTQQGVGGLAGQEKGKILRFNSYLSEKVQDYQSDHLRDLGNDERAHGDYLVRMYENRNQLITEGRKALEAELYSILSDRNRGPQFADQFLRITSQVFRDATEKFRREQEKPWGINEKARRKQYEESMQEMVEFRDKYGLTKQSKMEEMADTALLGIEGSFCALVQRKARSLGLEVVARLEEHLNDLERRYNQFMQRVQTMRDAFSSEADRMADSADALEVNGIKLFDRQELNSLYDDLLEQWAGTRESSKSRREVGLDVKCSVISEDILKAASPMWKDTRRSDEVMRLWDMTAIPEVKEEDLRELIRDRSRVEVLNAPESARMYSELAACDRLYKTYNDEQQIQNQIRIAYNKSQPLILLSKSVMAGDDAGFTPSTNVNVALLGGSKTADPAAQKMLRVLRDLEGMSEDNVKPLGTPERHRMVFVQETGGFSLRCVDGMRELRQSYQDWLGESIEAKRAQLKGESRDMPIPVHLQKEPPFWDLFPEDKRVFELVVLARALEVLREDKNQATDERTIRYDQTDEIGTSGIDIASGWDEAVQILEVRACQGDRAEIQRQVDLILEGAETQEEKQALGAKLLAYLDIRASQLAKTGGKDSPDYRREADVIRNTIRNYKLSTETPSEAPAATLISTPKPVVETEPVPEPVPVRAPEPAPAVGGDRDVNIIAKLKELAELKREGLLSEEEFQAAKAKLLGT